MRIGQFIVGQNKPGTGSRLSYFRIDDSATAPKVVFNRNNNANLDIQVFGQIDDYVLYVDASADAVGVGTNAPTAKLHVDQNDATGAIPVVKLDQGDASEPFVDYIGTSAADANNSITTWTTGNSIQGFVQVDINGTKYWMPYYDAPTS